MNLELQHDSPSLRIICSLPYRRESSQVFGILRKIVEVILNCGPEGVVPEAAKLSIECNYRVSRWEFFDAEGAVICEGVGFASLVERFEGFGSCGEPVDFIRV